MATVRGLKYLPGVLGACLMAMMQVGPSEAEINFCKWLQLAHPGAEEKCLSIPHLEPIVWTVAAGLCAATLLLLFFANHPGAKLALAGVGSRAEAFYDYIQRRGWRPIIREVRLDLHWRNQKLLLEIESLYLDRQYDVHIDLTQADVPNQNRARYSAVWLGSQAPEQRSIPRGVCDWIEVYEWEAANGADGFHRHFYFWHHVGGARQRTRTNVSIRRLNQAYPRSMIRLDIASDPPFADGTKTLVFSLEAARSLDYVNGDYVIGERE